LIKEEAREKDKVVNLIQSDNIFVLMSTQDFMEAAKTMSLEDYIEISLKREITVSIELNIPYLN
jgi:hypothetical protein